MSLNPPTYQELNQLNFNELRKRAKSIKGLKGKYGNLNRNELIDKIITFSKTPTYEELNQLNFNELRKRAKSIKSLKGKYGNLNKNELIDKIIKYEELNQLNSNELRKRAKSIKGLKGQYENLNRNKLIDKIITFSKTPTPKPKELNQLNFNELRKHAKSIKGLKGKYGNLNKNELIDKITKYEELNQLNLNELRKRAKSIKGLKGNLNRNKLIDKILKTTKPKEKKKSVIITPTYQELNQLNFYQLRKRAKSIKGIGKYGNLKKNELIDKIIKSSKPTPAPRTKKEKPTPAPRTKKEKPTPAPRTKKEKPTIEPRTKINKLDQALKGYTKSYEITIKNNKDPLLQLQNTRIALASHISSLLTSMNGLKFVEALKVTLTKISDGETIYKTVNFFSTPQTIINNTEINASLEASKQIILNKIAVWISEGSGWTIESVDNHYLNVVTYQPLTGSSYIRMPSFLRNKSLINMKNNDNECFRWCHIRHLNPQKKNPQRIKLVDKEYIKNLNYSGIEFPVTIKQYNKIEKQNNININVVSFCNYKIFPIYSSQERNKDELNLLLLTKTAGKHYILIKEKILLHVMSSALQL